MENLQIKITITDGEKEAKTTINVDDYKTMKELHGISLVDMQVEVLLDEIKTTKQKVMNIKTKYNIGDNVYIKTDKEQNPKIIISITVYTDDYYLYQLNSIDDCANYREFEISYEKDELLKLTNY